jgi:putative endonuclease
MSINKKKKKETLNQDEHYVYLLLCKDGTFYCGYTNNLVKRIATHNLGKGAKYTKTRRPVKLVYYESYSSKSIALKREFKIKKLSRNNKLKLINKIKSHIL